MSPRRAAETRRLVVELGAAALARFFLNTARRFAYPFAPLVWGLRGWHPRPI